MSMNVTRRQVWRLATATAAVAAGQWVRPSPARAAAAEPMILNVSGSITGGKDATRSFDRSALEAMPQHSLTTKTPWYTGPETFSGVLMRDILRQVGASGSRLLVVALNDYTSEIPIEDFDHYDVILALKRGGAYMPVSDKGPLFIVYPYDSDPVLQTEKFYNRSAWQVAQFVVK